VQARLLKQKISTQAIEAGVRAVAPVAPSKAFSILKHSLLDHGHLPCAETTLPVLLMELARVGDGDCFGKLAAAVEEGIVRRCAGADLADVLVRRDMQLLNLMLRCHARIDVDQAVQKVEWLYKRGVVIEAATYDQLAAKSLTAGNFEQAEEMLELRDYL
jgi:hypothetical protein